MRSFLNRARFAQNHEDLESSVAIPNYITWPYFAKALRMANVQPPQTRLLRIRRCCRKCGIRSFLPRAGTHSQVAERLVGSSLTRQRSSVDPSTRLTSASQPPEPPLL